MAKKSSEFLKALGRYFEISKAVLNAVLDQGGTDDDLARILSDAELRREIVRLIVAKSAKPVEPALPTEITVGGVTYEVLSPLRGDETSVNGYTMVERAKEMNANLGKEDCDNLLAHQSDIPPALRGKVAFVFTDLRGPDGRGGVAYVDWDGDGWYQSWGWLACAWHGGVRLLRRK